MGDLTRNFSRAEFACKCGCGFDDIDRDLVELLQQIRSALGAPLTITSGCRCEEHNAKSGGAVTSAHVSGHAVDIACKDGHLRFRLLWLAIKAGIRRIGLHKTFIHLDNHPTNPQEVVWFY